MVNVVFNIPTSARTINEGGWMMSRMEFTETPSNAAQSEDNTPPTLQPAVLESADKHVRFMLEILKWETALLPCTRYDEWLVCRLSLSSDKNGTKKTLTEEGPFLLRHEIAEISNAVQKALSADGTPARFASDFLEPVLTVKLNPPERPISHTTAGEITLALKPANTETETAQTLLETFQVERSAMEAFAKDLEQHLEAFPSLL